MGHKLSANHSGVSKSDEWLTPPELLQQLGEFDLDPCAPVQRPWSTAKHHFTIIDNGLLQEWKGRVFLNPPYGDVMEPFLQKLAAHGNGIALTFARTDTEAFHRHVFPHADSLFFIRQRLSFYTVAGTKARFNGGAPSVLIAYGEQNVDCLSNTSMKGRHVLLNYTPMIVIAVSPSWKRVVSIALNKLNGQAALNQVYDLVEMIAPDKVEKNQHYKAKIRQVLQEHFTRISKGYYVTFSTDL